MKRIILLIIALVITLTVVFCQEKPVSLSHGLNHNTPDSFCGTAISFNVFK